MRRTKPIAHRLVYIVLCVCGIFVVLYGAADALTRLARFTATSNLNQQAFGPAILLLDTKTTTQVPAVASVRGPIVPARLTLPTLGVTASVEALQLDALGAMQTPKKWGEVAWYSLGSKPGEPGSAVMAGHVNNALTHGGVFENLAKLTVGDEVRVEDARGNTLRYTATKIEDYATADAPLGDIFAVSGPSQLVLITCAGDWDPRAHSYDKRLVVFASPLR